MKNLRVFLIILTCLLICLQNTNAQIHISGEMSGTLLDTTYIVDDDIFIPLGSMLDIQPGAVLMFEEGVQFDIHGRLTAFGTETDSIYFIPVSEGVRWGGLDFHDESSYWNWLFYCYISGSNSSGIYAEGYCSPGITHCTITGNSATNYGGGIYFAAVLNDTINSCLITENEDCGIYMFFPSNSTLILNCEISYNEGGGVNYYSCSAPMQNCNISHNYSANDGAGISVVEGSPDIFNTIIQYNTSEGDGGGAFMGSSFDLYNCTIVHNHADGLGAGIFSDGRFDIYSSIVAYNTGAYGLYQDEIIYPTSHILYNCIFENDSSAFGSIYMQGGYGEITTQNNNGDPCDFQYNIFLDPQFVDWQNNFELTAGSPCINAGDPSLPNDPDGSINDIGAIPYSESAVWDNPRNRPQSSDISIKAFPNPTNGMIKLSFDNLSNSPVTWSMYDILGRVVLNGQSNKNLQSFQTLNMSHLTSGQYFIHVYGQDKSLNKKIILLK